MAAVQSAAAPKIHVPLGLTKRYAWHGKGPRFLGTETKQAKRRGEQKAVFLWMVWDENHQLNNCDICLVMYGNAVKGHSHHPIHQPRGYFTSFHF